MKWISVLLLAVGLLLGGCRKALINAAVDSSMINPEARLRPGFPKLPKPVLPLTICINSYDELVQLLGTNHVIAQSVILANGEIMRPGLDLKTMTYEAVQQNQTNSLFGSRFTLEWRFPGGNWQLNTSDVWTLGCTYLVAGEPPYTNLIKDGNIIEINTCFFWETNIFTGERVDYIVID